MVHLQAVREDQRNNVAAVERGVGPPDVGGTLLRAERIGGGKADKTVGLGRLDGNPRSFCCTHANGRIACPTYSRRSLTFPALWPGREPGIAKRTHAVPRSKGRRSEVAAAARRQLLPDGDNCATQHEVRKTAGDRPGWHGGGNGDAGVLADIDGACGALLVKALGAWTGRVPGGP